MESNFFFFKLLYDFILSLSYFLILHFSFFFEKLIFLEADFFFIDILEGQEI